MKRFFLLDFYNYCLESDDFILTDKCVYLRIGNLKIEFENPFIDNPCFSGCAKTKYGFIDWHTFFELFKDKYRLLLPYEQDEVKNKIYNRDGNLNCVTINFIDFIDNLVKNIGFDYDDCFRIYIYHRIFHYYESSHNRYFYKLMNGIYSTPISKISLNVVREFVCNYYDFENNIKRTLFNDEINEYIFNKLKNFFNNCFLKNDKEFIYFEYNNIVFRTYSECFSSNVKVNNKPVFHDSDLDLLFGLLLNAIAFYYYDYL